jgi:hypothetical protein
VPRRRFCAGLLRLCSPLLTLTTVLGNSSKVIDCVLNLSVLEVSDYRRDLLKYPRIAETGRLEVKLALTAHRCLQDHVPLRNYLRFPTTINRLIKTCGPFTAQDGLMITRNAFGGGLETQAILGLMAIMLLVLLALAYYNIKRLQIEQHRAWMRRA